MNKIKITLCASLLAFSTNTLLAQYLTVTPKIGFNICSLSGLDGPTQTSSISSIGGGVGFMCGNGNIKMSLDILYSAQGSTFTAASSDIAVNPNYPFVPNDAYKASFKYIQLPVLVNYFFMDKDGKFRPRLGAGLSLGSLINATLDDNTANTSTNVTNKYREIDYSAVADAGFNYRINDKLSFIMDLRYNYGLKDVSPNELNANIIRNTVMSVFVGIAYSLDKYVP